LPLVGLLSLLLRSQLDPHLESYRAHFVVFGLVGGIAFGLGFAAGEAAGVLIGAETFDQLPEGAVVEERRGLRVKGKHDVVNAYVLLALP
jgi:RsiW-degrading membrane proteinase PrsW (M82 family)